MCVDMQEQLLQLQLPACDPRMYRIEEFKLLRSMWSATACRKAEIHATAHHVERATFRAELAIW